MAFSKVVITQIKAKGFKGFEKEFSISLIEGKNIFEGENSQGKSTTGDLIAWIVSGRNAKGKQKELRLINNKTSSAYGMMEFYDEQRQLHTIERKLGNATIIKFDGNKISQEKLDQLIPVNFFLFIFNPMYFLSLDPTTSREAIYSLLPQLTKEDVLQTMSDFQQELLRKEDFSIYTVNTFLKNKRNSLKEGEDKIKALIGYIDGLKRQTEVAIPGEKTFDESILVQEESRFLKLNEEKADLLDLSSLLLQKNELDRQLSELRHQPFNLEKQLLTLQSQKQLIETELEWAKKQPYESLLDIADLESQLTTLRNEYKMELSQSIKLEKQIALLKKEDVLIVEGDSCQSCHQIITTDVVNAINNELTLKWEQEKQHLQDLRAIHLQAVVELESKGLALTAQIDKAKKEDEQRKQLFLHSKDEDIQKRIDALQQIELEIQQLAEKEKGFNVEKESKMQMIQKQIANLGIEEITTKNELIQKAFRQEISNRYGQLQQKISLLRNEKEAVLRHNTERSFLLKQIESAKQELTQKESERSLLEEEMNQINAIIELMKDFNAKKISLMNTFLSVHLHHVSLKLEKPVQSTGEIRDCFEVLYDGNELNVASTSENIKAGLEFSHMISVLTGLDYPIFVDNGESITHYEDRGKQVIETRVKEGKNLTLIQNGNEMVLLPLQKGTKSA